MTLVTELLNVREKLRTFVEESVEQQVLIPISKLEDAANEVGKTWSGSWLGYQSCVYYAHLEPPPAGAQFSIEWGFQQLYSMRATTGDWNEFTFDHIRNEIFRIANNPDIDQIDLLASKANGVFGNLRSEALSIFQIDLEGFKDVYVESLLAEVHALKVLKQTEIEESWMPTREVITRDSLALAQRIPDTSAYRSPSTGQGASLSIRGVLSTNENCYKGYLSC